MALPLSITTFSGTAGTALATSDSRFTVAMGSFAVSGFGRVGPTNSAYSMAYINSETFANNQYAEVTFDAVVANGLIYAGPAVRMQSNGDCYNFAATDGAGGTSTVYLSKMSGGASSDLSSTTVTLAAGDVLRIEAEGTTIRCLKNGVQVMSVTDATFSSGNAGINGWGNSYSALNMWDMEFGNLSSSGVTGTGALADQAAAMAGTGLLTPYRRVIRPATILGAQTSAIAGTGTVA